MISGSATESRSLRRGFVWNLGGSVLYNLSQWVLIWIVAKFSSPEVVGEFTLLLALAAPIFLTIGLNLRTMQVTDTTRRYSLDDYFVVRTVTNVVAGTVTLIVGGLLGYAAELFGALIFIALAKAIENLSLSSYGYFALMGRFDFMAQSMILRAVLGPILFASAFWAGGQLWLACAGLAVGWLIVGSLFDSRRVRALAKAEDRPRRGWRGSDVTRIKEMVRRALPLGLDQGVSSYAVNLPRYGVESVLGVGKLGVYGAQAYLAQVVTMVTMAMTAVFVPRLARAYARNDRRAFVRDLGRMCVVGSGVAIAGIIGAAVLGEWFLRVTLGPEYANSDLLVLLMVSSWLITLQRVLSKGLEASHQFRNYLLVDVITLVSIVVPLWPLLSHFGVIGAAIASSLGFAIGTAVMTLFLWSIIRGMPVCEDPPPAADRK
jgi:O-antigen/teichoic acid export membrane protein